MRSNSLFFSIVSAVLLMGCAADGILNDARDKSFEASFEQPVTTRTYLGHEGSSYQMYWTYGDKVSVFEPESFGIYHFGGSTGSSEGPLFKVTYGENVANFRMTRNYAVYPYSSSTTLVSDGVIQYTIPATQTYAADSFGPGAGLMVAATQSVQDNQLSFQSAVGYLVLNIYGTAKIKSIALKGKADEPLSGAVKIAVSDSQAPAITFQGENGTTLILDCGQGVSLGSTAETATTFWIAVPPTTFSSGITVTVTDNKGHETVQSTNNQVNIVRNVYQPMAAFCVDKYVDPNTPEEPEIPDNLLTVTGTLPVLYINLPENVLVTSIDKENWVKNSHAYLKDTDGTVTSLGTASIRGRGNSTWFYSKKPYALKLDNKASLLGMPKDKRWDLLANYIDRTRLRNDIALEMGRRLTGLDWTPKGRYVELVVNNVHFGNYYLVEHIKVSKDRVNITELGKDDNSDETKTGGYLMEMSLEFDEEYKFGTDIFPDLFYESNHNHQGPGGYYTLPVMIKEPDTLTTTQFDYIKNYVNTAQASIVYYSTDNTWLNYIDLDSFVDYMFVQEVVGNFEPVHPKSCYMYKDRGGKLMMGPLWDFDYNTFTPGYSTGTVFNYAIWYGYMRNNAAFRAKVRERWPAAKAAFTNVLSYVTTQAAAIKSSAQRDWNMWGCTTTINGDESLTYDAAVQRLYNNLQAHITSMDNAVSIYFNN